ncbi:MAG: hypothetical protein ABSA03_21635 [Streptosporangiaceae bacterium]|jgi:hypothetical protein
MDGPLRVLAGAGVRGQVESGMIEPASLRGLPAGTMPASPAPRQPGALADTDNRRTTAAGANAGRGDE